VSTVTIVGAGYMGSALAWPLTDRGHRVRLVGTPLDHDIIRACLRDGRHPNLQRPLPEGVRPYPIELLEEALDGADLIVQGVSSPGVEWFAATVGPRLVPGRPLLSITKGLGLDDDGLPCLLPDLVERRLPERLRGRVPWAAVGGPCIAGELAGRRQTCVVFTGHDAALLEHLAGMLHTEYYHVWTSTDVVGVEACVALKNGYTLGVALALGILEAAGGPDAAGAAMHNLCAALFAQAGMEMATLVQALGGDPRSVHGLPGIGDLFVTVQGGRSVLLGRLLGSGLPIEPALARLEGVTLESAEVLRLLARALPNMERRGLLQPSGLPLLQHLAEVVTQGKPVSLPLDRFFQVAAA